MGEVCQQKTSCEVNTNIYTEGQKQHISSHISGQNCSTFNKVDQLEQNKSLCKELFQPDLEISAIDLI